MNKTGQFSIYDAVLFLVILTLASSALLFYTHTPNDWERAVADQKMQDECEMALNLLMLATIRNATYINTTNEEVLIATAISIADALVFEAKNSASGYDFSPLHTKINESARMLVGHLYKYMLRVAHGTKTLLNAGYKHRTEHYVYSYTDILYNASAPAVRVELFLWVP